MTVPGYRRRRITRTATAITGAATAAIRLSAGWLGGKLAYRYGVRVAAETAQAGYR